MFMITDGFRQDAVLMQTWPNPSAGTGAPKQRVVLQALQASCRSWAREFICSARHPLPPCNKIA
jgi:hypothetical protein